MVNPTTNGPVSRLSLMIYIIQTTRSQTAHIGLSILQVAFAQGNYSQVREYIRKVELTVGKNGGGGLGSASPSATAAGGGGGISPSNASSSNTMLQDVTIKLEIAKGIERMIAGDYSSAARSLIPLVINGSNSSNTNNNNNNNQTSLHMLDWPGVTCPEDLALYASLMCLVSQSQDRSKVLELADHPEALELVPGIKDLLLQWTRANYVKCMEVFAPSASKHAVAPLLPMGVDVYLSPPRWKKLAQQIREMCLVEYLRPFQCVKIESMQRLFPTLGPNLVDTLVDLMSRGMLPPTTRLDCRAGIIFKTPKTNNPTRQVQVMEECVLDDAHALLVRLACLESDLVVQDPSGGGPARGGRGRTLRGGNLGGFIPAENDSSDDEEDNESDTPMIDAEAAAAMNPEDLY